MTVTFAMALAAGFLAGFLMISARIPAEVNHRSNHSGSKSTAGGLCIVAAMGAAALAAGPVPKQMAYLLAMLLVLAAMGLRDDLSPMRSIPKLIIILGLSALAVWVIGPVLVLPWPGEGTGIVLPMVIGFAGAMLWLIVVINAVNFVDGSNGMMALNMLVSTAALFLLCVLQESHLGALLSTGLMAGLISLSFFNARRSALIFAGDVGALSVGLVYGLCVLILAQTYPQAVFAGPLLILPILTDVMLTLLRRARTGESLLEAHNNHLFQRLIRSGKSHLQVTGLFSAATLLCAVIVLGASLGGMLRSPVLMVSFVAISVIVYALISSRFEPN